MSCRSGNAFRCDFRHGVKGGRVELNYRIVHVSADDMLYVETSHNTDSSKLCFWSPKLRVVTTASQVVQVVLCVTPEEASLFSMVLTPKNARKLFLCSKSHVLRSFNRRYHRSWSETYRCSACVCVLVSAFVTSPVCFSPPWCEHVEHFRSVHTRW